LTLDESCFYLSTDNEIISLREGEASVRKKHDPGDKINGQNRMELSRLLRHGSLFKSAIASNKLLYQIYSTANSRFASWIE
jgi:hypothetical protein